MRYTVPQFIDVEDKILGPLTGRQFLIMLVVSFTLALMWKLLDFTAFLVFGIPLFALALVVAFFRVNGQPFHYFVLNLVQTFQRPGIRVWDKTIDDAELRAILHAPPPPPPKARIHKEPLAATKLTELSLVVNTGGTYNPED
jgi:hypothetical protein